MKFNSSRTGNDGTFMTDNPLLSSSSSSSRMKSTMTTMIMATICSILFLNLLGGNPYCKLNVSKDHVVDKNNNKNKNNRKEEYEKNSIDANGKNNNYNIHVPISSFSTVKDAIESIEYEYEQRDNKYNNDNDNVNVDDDDGIATVSNVYSTLPKRLITIFGLESSGVEYIKNDIFQKILNIPYKTNHPDDDYITFNETLRIRSITLPTSYTQTSDLMTTGG